MLNQYLTYAHSACFQLPATFTPIANARIFLPKYRLLQLAERIWVKISLLPRAADRKFWKIPILPQAEYLRLEKMYALPHAEGHRWIKICRLSTAEGYGWVKICSLPTAEYHKLVEICLLSGAERRIFLPARPFSYHTEVLFLLMFWPFFELWGRLFVQNFSGKLYKYSINLPGIFLNGNPRD